MPRKSKRPEAIPVDAADLNPGHRWHRPLQAPGISQVDFEERVDFQRLHRYRLARTRRSLAASGFGAMLCFDQHNIRYISSTVIGEWARDKLIRYCLLTGTGDPWVWDFGSAARHHKLYCPWLKEDHVRAGNPGMRGAIGPDVGLFEAAAKEIKDILVIREGGRPPCTHVHQLLRDKAAELDRKLKDLVDVRERIRRSLAAWNRQPQKRAPV